MATILFDLDGTLTNSAPGITKCFRDALKKMGQEAPDVESLGWVIGPPLRNSFAKVLKDEAKAEEAVSIYRSFYTDYGIFDAEVYQGIKQSLIELKSMGYKMMVCTAKAQVHALSVIEHFGLSSYFEAIYGPGLDGTLDNKAELLAKLIRVEKINIKKACLIGDRLYDMQAAVKNKIIPIGALWGFGTKEELLENGAKEICPKPQEIPKLIKNIFP